MQPERPRPDQMPDPWLRNTEALLNELDRIRNLPCEFHQLATKFSTRSNSVVDAVWDL
jgi:hypothetical protein